MKTVVINKLLDVINELEKEVPDVKADQVQMLYTGVIRPLLKCRIIKNVDVAKMLHVSPSTIANMIQEGSLTTTADGKITEHHLWKYLTNNKEEEK